MINFVRKLGFGVAPSNLYEKPKPKKFNYSSEANALILESAISDCAALTAKTTSSIIEDTLIDRFIPLNDHARYYVCGVLLGKKNNLGAKTWTKYGIREALVEITSNESIGTEWQSAHRGTGKAIIEYASELLQKNTSKFCKEQFNSSYSRVRDAINSWDSIIGVLDVAANNEANLHQKIALEKEVRLAQATKETMSLNPNYYVFNAFRFILQNWDILGAWTHTWRFVSAVLESVDSWEDAPEDRIAFREVCEDVFSVWDGTDAKKKKQIKKEQEDAALTTYDMRDGTIIKAPRTWIVTNPEKAIESDYAGVIEIRNGDRYDAPHFLFFIVDHPVSELNEVERLNVLRDATSKWPHLIEIQDDIVELQYGPDGGVLNQKEYMRSPCIGFFPIWDKGRYPLGEPPYGAVIIRAEGRDDQ